MLCLWTVVRVMSSVVTLRSGVYVGKGAGRGAKKVRRWGVAQMRPGQPTVGQA